MGRREEGGMDGGRGSERDRKGWTEVGRDGRREEGEGGREGGGKGRTEGGRRGETNGGREEGGEWRGRQGGREVNITPTHLQGLHNYYVDIFKLLYRPSCLLI